MCGLSRRDLLLTGLVGVTAANFPLRPWRRGSTDPDAEIVAGGPNDFMTVRHLKLKGSNQEIGQSLAKTAQTLHGTTLGKADDTLVNRARWFEHHYPAMAERAKGVCSAYSASYAELEVDPFSLGYDLLNQPGCSTVFYPGSKTESRHAILSRNYDFGTRTYAEMIGREPRAKDRAFTADPYLLELHPANGLASLALVSYDLLCGCIDGVNEKGLTVALLADDMSEGSEPTRGPRVGLGEIEVPRFLLDTCATVEEAIIAVQNLERYYSFIPCHYIVGDSGGHSAVLEWSIPDGKLLVTASKDKPQIVTNHLLAKFSDRHQFPTDQWAAGSFNRYCKLEDQITGAKGKLSMAQIKTFNQSVQAGPDKGPQSLADDPKPHRTLWHSVYDCHERSVEISFYLGESPDGRHNQRRTDYLRFKLG